jgi:hypothetical protein
MGKLSFREFNRSKVLLICVGAGILLFLESVAFIRLNGTAHLSPTEGSDSISQASNAPTSLQPKPYRMMSLLNQSRGPSHEYVPGGLRI